MGANENEPPAAKSRKQLLEEYLLRKRAGAKNTRDKTAAPASVRVPSSRRPAAGRSAVLAQNSGTADADRLAEGPTGFGHDQTKAKAAAASGCTAENIAAEPKTHWQNLFKAPKDTLENELSLGTTCPTDIGVPKVEQSDATNTATKDAGQLPVTPQHSVQLHRNGSQSPKEANGNGGCRETLLAVVVNSPLVSEKFPTAKCVNSLVPAPGKNDLFWYKTTTLAFVQRGTGKVICTRVSPPRIHIFTISSVATLIQRAEHPMVELAFKVMTAPNQPKYANPSRHAKMWLLFASYQESMSNCNAAFATYERGIEADCRPRQAVRDAFFSFLNRMDERGIDYQIQPQYAKYLGLVDDDGAHRLGSSAILEIRSSPKELPEDVAASESPKRRKPQRAATSRSACRPTKKTRNGTAGLHRRLSMRKSPVTVLTPVRVSPQTRMQLDSPLVVTPAKRSSRNILKYSGLCPLKDVQEGEQGLAYVPNKAIPHSSKKSEVFVLVDVPSRKSRTRGQTANCATDDADETDGDNPVAVALQSEIKQSIKKHNQSLKRKRVTAADSDSETHVHETPTRPRVPPKRARKSNAATGHNAAVGGGTNERFPQDRPGADVESSNNPLDSPVLNSSDAQHTRKKGKRAAKVAEKVKKPQKQLVGREYDLYFQFKDMDKDRSSISDGEVSNLKKSLSKMK